MFRLFRTCGGDGHRGDILMAALQKLRDHGLTAEARDDKLIVTPSECLTDELRAYIRQHKPEIMAALATPQMALTADETAAVNEWLDTIGETEPQARREWLERSANDPETLHYTVRRLALSDLENDPGLKYAFRVVSPETDPVRLVIAIRNNGTVDLLIPKKKWDPFVFMEMLNGQQEKLH